MNNNIKKIVRILALLCLAAVALSTAALADTGPKPSLTVKLLNAPDEPYYLDLLAPDGELVPGEGGLSAQELAGLDQDMLSALLGSVPEGWHACLVQGPGRPIFGELTFGDGVHCFSYVGVPDTYRILVVTRSGEVWSSETLQRRVLQSSVTVDWAAKQTRVPALWLGFALQFLFTLLPTLLIELAVLLLFRFDLRQNIVTFLWVNLLTQGLLALFTSAQALGNGVSSWFIVWFVPLELVIAFAEAAIYRKLLRGHAPRRAFVCGVTANAASALAGWYCLGPVWRWVTSLC